MSEVLEALIDVVWGAEWGSLWLALVWLAFVAGVCALGYWGLRKWAFPWLRAKHLAAGYLLVLILLMPIVLRWITTDPRFTGMSGM